MEKTAFLFPGQGSQFVGMGLSFYEESDYARKTFEKAEEILGLPLRKYCFEGPMTELTNTRIAQPAIFTVSYIVYNLLANEGICPTWVAGHSLGEYTALAAAGVLSFEDALLLVKKRGELMSQVSGEGGMTAVLNTSREVLEKLVKELSEKGLIELANYNSPSQIVVSGEKRLVQELTELINTQKKGKAIQLEVSGAFHSKMMMPVAEEFSKELKSTTFNPLSVPLVANASAEVTTDSKDLPELLKRQLYSPVRWEQSLTRLSSLGCDSYLEVGGKVLTGLVKKTLKNVKCYSIVMMEDFKKVLAILKEV